MPRLTPEVERVLRPLIRRAARFGPYFWLGLLAGVVSTQVILLTVGSPWFAAAWAFITAALLDSDAANHEHAIEKWLREVP